KAVHARQRRTVHVVGEKIGRIVEPLKRVPGRVPFRGIEYGVLRCRQNSGALDERLQESSLPDGVSNVTPTDGIGNAFQSERGFVNWQVAHFLVSKAKRNFHQAIDLEGPRFGIDRRLAV